METKVNSGAIFKNDKKAKETHPDYRGKVNVNGKDWELSLWIRESKNGVKYFSVGVSEPWVPNQSPNQSPNQNEGREALKNTIIRESGFDNDDLPF
jgi:uncharacterized protein (DUF736 family)